MLLSYKLHISYKNSAKKYYRGCFLIKDEKKKKKKKTLIHAIYCVSPHVVHAKICISAGFPQSGFTTFIYLIPTHTKIKNVEAVIVDW